MSAFIEWRDRLTTPEHPGDKNVTVPICALRHPARRVWLLWVPDDAIRTSEPLRSGRAVTGDLTLPGRNAFHGRNGLPCPSVKLKPVTNSRVHEIISSKCL
jgi:hypothetical protein